MPERKAALLEIYDSHDETLFSQIRFLQAGGYQVTLITSLQLKNAVKDYHSCQEHVYVDIKGKKGLAQWRALWKLRNYIVREGFEAVIFNTAHGTLLRNFFFLPFPKRIRFYGVLHMLQKLKGSFTQNRISRRIPNYLVLNDYLLDEVKKWPHRGLRFGALYSIFPPRFPEANAPEKPPGVLWVAIPGTVEYTRRDYKALVKSVSEMKHRDGIQFLILGNGDHPKYGNGRDLQKLVSERGLQDNFVFFNGFLGNDVFHHYISRCDAVMPLAHPLNSDFTNYRENQISGAFNLAFAYKIPLLMHEAYRGIPDFDENGVFYREEDLATLLDRLPEALAEKKESYQQAKWSFDFQAKQYLDFISA